MSRSRSKIPKGKSRRMFSRTAGNYNVHPKNLRSAMPMRGGFRL